MGCRSEDGFAGLLDAFANGLGAAYFVSNFDTAPVPDAAGFVGGGRPMDVPDEAAGFLLDMSNAAICRVTDPIDAMAVRK